MKDILVLEDSPQERERLERLFSAEGYSVKACATVAEAERVVQAENYRLAILDIGLSDKSGSYFFNSAKHSGRVTYIVVFTGNPSMHLKERFLSEGAVDYIVKGSPQAQSESLLHRVKEIIGKAQPQAVHGIPLDTFLREYVSEKSRSLFFDMENSYPSCSGCASRQYIVEFSSQVQVPPDVKGKVVCSVCGRVMDIQVE